MYESNENRALATNKQTNKQTKKFRYVIPVSLEFKGHQKNIKGCQTTSYIYFVLFVCVFFTISGTLSIDHEYYKIFLTDNLCR